MKFFPAAILLLLTLNSLKGQVKEGSWSVPVNLSRLNSAEDDFAPSWNRYENLLYFCSVKEGWSRFYTSAARDSLNFGEPQFISGDLNQAGKNQSYICFKSGEEAYLTGFRLFASRSYFNIFESVKKKQSWSKPFPVESLSEEVNLLHPSISPDGKTLVFASDRLSDKGDTDLWEAFQQQDGSWSGLFALNELNTTGNEITPFLAASDTLYFASNGLGGLGGYNIYMSVFLEGKWQKPFPVIDANSEYDDSDFIILPGGAAVFASDRPGGAGKLDLYLVKRKYGQIAEQENTAKPDLSIAVQSPLISADREFEYRLLIPQIIFSGLDFEHFCFDSAAVNSPVTFEGDNEVLINAGLSSVFKNIKESKGSVMRIDYTADKIDTSGLKSALAKRTGIGINSLYFNKINVLPGLSSMIILNSSEPKIFQPYEYGKQKSRYSPSVLEIYLNARPWGTVKSWDCNIIAAGKRKPIKSGITLPDTIRIDFRNFTDFIFTENDFDINFKVRGNFGETEESYTADIIVNTVRRKLFKEINSRKYCEYYFFGNFGDEGSNMEIIRSQLDFIFTDSVKIPDIKIEYYRSSSLRFANSIRDAIRSIEPDAKIDIGISSDFNGLPCDRQLTPFIFRMLVEE